MVQIILYFILFYAVVHVQILIQIAALYDSVVSSIDGYCVTVEGEGY